MERGRGEYLLCAAVSDATPRAQQLIATPKMRILALKTDKKNLRQFGVAHEILYRFHER